MESEADDATTDRPQVVEALLQAVARSEARTGHSGRPQVDAWLLEQLASGWENTPATLAAVALVWRPATPLAPSETLQRLSREWHFNSCEHVEAFVEVIHNLPES